ncbi:MAG: dolichyl-phosphate-mannose--protein O-mannosyl transferase [Verrucomicrobiaceae bacterium]|nr:dolichyl-phosphate-mannose--protein O-mannosyl transferase [Verrucomicrobiaceae bacterium]
MSKEKSQWAWVLYVMFIVTTTGFAQQAIDTPGNILVNGAFTGGTTGWSFRSAAKTGMMAVDTAVMHANRPSVRVDNIDYDLCSLSQKVMVKPNTHYRMTVFIRTKDADPEKRGAKHGGSMSILGGYVMTPPVTGTKVWTRVMREFDTGNETEIEIGLNLGYYYAKVKGTAWFADASLVDGGKAHSRK